MDLTDLAGVGARIADGLGRPGPTRSVLALSECVGNAVRAFRAGHGVHQYVDDPAKVGATLASLVITAFTTAAELGIDLPAEIEQEVGVVFARTDWQVCDT